MPQAIATATNRCPSGSIIAKGAPPHLLWLCVGIAAISGIWSALNETGLLLPTTARGSVAPPTTAAAATPTKEEPRKLSAPSENKRAVLHGNVSTNDYDRNGIAIAVAQKELQNLRQVLGCDTKNNGNGIARKLSPFDCLERARRLVSQHNHDQVALGKAQGQSNDNEVEASKWKRLFQCRNIHRDCAEKAAFLSEHINREREMLESVRAEARKLLRDNTTGTTATAATSLYYYRNYLTRMMNNKKDWQRHPALTPLLPKYAPKRSWPDSFPDFNVVGLAKAGTSKLFSILAGHDNVQAANYHGKEYCMSSTHRATWPIRSMAPLNKTYVQQKLFRYHEQLSQLRQYSIPPNKLTVNGCLNYQDLYLHLRYVRPVHKKFIVLFRDPADWLWSSWNFWWDPDLDQERPVTRNYTHSGVHYRSPELFHELILSAGKLRPARTLLSYRSETVELPRRLIQFAGRQNTLFLRSEDMRRRQAMPPLHQHDPKHSHSKEDNKNFLDRLCAFTGLNRTGFGTRVLETLYETENCNDAKTEECGNRTTTAYKVAQGRSMLDSTRQLIYLHFAKECQIWAKEFGIVYQACLDAVDKKQ